MKSIDKRIVYYTRKLAERSAHHPSKALPRNYLYRYDRLIVYKKRLNELIEGLKCKSL